MMCPPAGNWSNVCLAAQAPRDFTQLPRTPGRDGQEPGRRPGPRQADSQPHPAARGFEAVKWVTRRAIGGRRFSDDLPVERAKSVIHHHHAKLCT